MKRITPRGTLLEVIRAVAAEAKTDAELFAAVTHMVRTGKVELIGPFRIMVKPAPLIV